MNPSEKHILEIDSVELSFGDRVILSSVYLAVETGGATALLGRNGSGKSCLMKILCGALRPGFRSMRIDGKWYDRFGSSQVRYLPQQGFTPGWLTVEAVLRDFGLEWADIREVAEGENPNPFRRGAAYFGVFRYSAQPEPFRSARRTFFTSRAIACCNFESFDSGGKTK